MGWNPARNISGSTQEPARAWNNTRRDTRGSPAPNKARPLQCWCDVKSNQKSFFLLYGSTRRFLYLDEHRFLSKHNEWEQFITGENILFNKQNTYGTMINGFYNKQIKAYKRSFLSAYSIISQKLLFDNMFQLHIGICLCQNNRFQVKCQVLFQLVRVDIQEVLYLIILIRCTIIYHVRCHLRDIHYIHRVLIWFINWLYYRKIIQYNYIITRNVCETCITP